MSTATRDLKKKRKTYESDDSDDSNDAHKKRLCPTKDDRGNSSNREGFSTVIASHYNNIRESGIEKRKESRIFFMRSFNNWLKSSVIAQALHMIRESKKIDPDRENGDITVLDLGCGKGGDLNKYCIGKIKHLVCADIAKESLNECKNRYNFMIQRERGKRMFSAEFIHMDATKDNLTEKLLNKDIKFDLVSCQFTFHYCFESLPQAERMLENISNNLVKGGYFIGTTPDAYDIVARLRRDGKDGSFGNEIYSINFDKIILQSEKIPLFGARYDFHLEGVVDCPEFLVYFPALERLAAKYGLKMLFKRKFDEFYEENRTQALESELLTRINALETYPPKMEPLKGAMEDYSHAQRFLDELGQQKKISHVGTLSKPEWEATCLYLVFAFVKQ